MPLICHERECCSVLNRPGNGARIPGSKYVDIIPFCDNAFLAVIFREPPGRIPGDQIVIHDVSRNGSGLDLGPLIILRQDLHRGAAVEVADCLRISRRLRPDDSTGRNCIVVRHRDAVPVLIGPVCHIQLESLVSGKSVHSCDG